MIPKLPPRVSPAVRVRIRQWVIFGICCCLFATAQLGAEAERRRELRRWRDAVASFTHTRQQIQGRLESLVGQDVQSLQRQFNGGAPFPVNGEFHERRVSLVFPTAALGSQYADWRIVIHLDEKQTLQRYLIIPPRWPLRPEPAAVWRLVGRFRQTVTILGFLTWAGGVVLLPFAMAQRREIAQVCLGAALAGTLGWCLDPTNDWRTRLNIDRAGALAGGVAILLTLPAALLPARKLPNFPPCPACGYDLTGNVSGLCPECGRTTPAAEHQRRLARWRGVEELLVQSPPAHETVDGEDQIS